MASSKIWAGDSTYTGHGDYLHVGDQFRVRNGYFTTTATITGIRDGRVIFDTTTKYDDRPAPEPTKTGHTLYPRQFAASYLWDPFASRA